MAFLFPLYHFLTKGAQWQMCERTSTNINSQYYSIEELISAPATLATTPATQHMRLQLVGLRLFYQMAVDNT